MDVYRQAAEIVNLVKKGNGTAKALCLRKEVQKKKQTYAVVCETLRYYELLKDVLDMAEFFKYYPRANRSLAMVLCYDQVVGKGVNTNNDTTARAIRESSAFLREAYWRVEKHHVIPPKTAAREDGEDLESGKEKESAFSGSSSSIMSSAPIASLVRLPRYARVNTLKIQKIALVERLERAREAIRKRMREDSEECKKKKPRKVLPPFHEDAVIPDLLVFPPGTDLHAHPAVRSGQLILQDRSSCLPAAILLDAIPSELSFKEDNRALLEYVIDACAAPGNKTTHLAALGAEQGIRIMAIERDEQRATLLNQRIHSLGASDYVNVVNMDFFDLVSSDREATEAILLDPSCSASGVISRVDVAIATQGKQHIHGKEQGQGEEYRNIANSTSLGITADSHEASKRRNTSRGVIAAQAEGEAEFKDTSAFDGEAVDGSNLQKERVMKLARLQRKLLAHALLSFDHCRTVVYSTCSKHKEENEDVVKEVLLDERVIKRGWCLSNILPRKHQWKTRGIKEEGDTIPLEFTIRCSALDDATNGFFVARFDRPTPSRK